MRTYEVTATVILSVDVPNNWPEGLPLFGLLAHHLRGEFHFPYKRDNDLFVTNAALIEPEPVVEPENETSTPPG